MSMIIKSIKAWEILDSRGHPTVQVKVSLNNGITGEAAVPSGASTGSYEALELRDNDSSRYQGKSVLQAIKNIEEKIAPCIIGQAADKQIEIDQQMIDLDGTDNKSNLGANAILGVSLAVARSAAAALHQPLYDYLLRFSPLPDGPYVLPVPMMNVLNGGQHANWSSDIQEYMILPVGAHSFSEAIRMGSEVYHSLRKILKDKGYHLGVGDEGGFAPNFADNEEPFKLLTEAVIESGYSLGEDIVFAIDAAANEFFHDNLYHLKKENKELSSSELSAYYQTLMDRYPLVSLEDVFAENDWSAFSQFTAQVHPWRQVVGDDLYVTNLEFINKGITTKATNSVLIKLNQIGTLTETIAAINLAHQADLNFVISHRSGETEDSFIADLAVAMGGGQIKTGAPARSERTAKYNRLLAIEQELGDKAIYWRWPFAGK